MSIEDLLQHVPPEVIYHRVPLADDDNAFGPWSEAAKHLVPPPEEEESEEQESEECDTGG